MVGFLAQVITRRVQERTLSFVRQGESLPTGVMHLKLYRPPGELAYVKIPKVSLGRAGDVLKAAVEKKPDTALLDIEMPGRTAWTQRPGSGRNSRPAECLMLTTFGRPFPQAHHGGRGSRIPDTGHAGSLARIGISQGSRRARHRPAVRHRCAE